MTKKEAEEITDKNPKGDDSPTGGVALMEENKDPVKRLG